MKFKTVAYFKTSTITGLGFLDCKYEMKLWANLFSWLSTTGKPFWKGIIILKKWISDFNKNIYRHEIGNANDGKRIDSLEVWANRSPSELCTNEYQTYKPMCLWT